MRTKTLILVGALAGSLTLGGGAPRLRSASGQPVVVEVDLTGVVQSVSADYVVNGIHYANDIGANAVLLRLSTPGGLEASMRDIIEAVVASHVPVITYVAPSGARAASAGFFILVSGDLAVMAPGTNTGAAHPVVIGGFHVGKTMETKIENDAAAYIRAIASKRGRNVKLAESAVRESKSFTDQEALDDHLIDAIASSPQDIFKQFDGKTIERFNGSAETLHLAGARLKPYRMPRFKQFLSWLADPNIAFILGAIGALGIYVEFTHPGFVLPGVVGAIALVLALFGFHLLPINYAGVILILLAVALFALEAKLASHGVLAVGGAIAMIIGSLVLINSPWPGTHIHLSTSLSVTLPLVVITFILLKATIASRRLKAVTGESAMIGAEGVAETDLSPEGKIMIHGEIWNARSSARVARGTGVRVKSVEGLRLLVEPSGAAGEGELADPAGSPPAQAGGPAGDKRQGGF
jgi:membrane-bound serine protease (ClpP class)